MASSWTYALIPLSDLDNALPFDTFNYVVRDEDENETTVHPTFKQSAEHSRRVVLGAASDTHRIWKAQNLSFVNGEVQALIDLGYALMPANEAAAWAAALPKPEEYHRGSKVNKNGRAGTTCWNGSIGWRCNGSNRCHQKADGKEKRWNRL